MDFDSVSRFPYIATVSPFEIYQNDNPCSSFPTVVTSSGMHPDDGRLPGG
jgi:hypothetical protein